MSNCESCFFNHSELKEKMCDQCGFGENKDLPRMSIGEKNDM
jgi:ribosomal protein L37E